jgi:hypothetical protein
MLKCFGNVALLATALFASALVTPATAWGQGRDRQLPTVNVKGTIQGREANVFKVQTEAEEVYLIAVDPKTTKVTVTGEAERGVLKPGMLVRFNAALTNKGIGTADVEELTIFTMYEGASIGAFAEGDGFFVAGQIKSVKDRRVTVIAGKDQVQINLSEEPKIGVDVNDYSVARLGDTIELTGKLGSPGHVLATEMSIKLVEPLTTEKPKRARTKTKKEGDTDDAEADKKEAEKEKKDGEKDKKQGEKEKKEGEADTKGGSPDGNDQSSRG